MQILDGGPASKGGIQLGDVILTMNGKPVVMSADLPHLVGALKSGDTARMEIMREGKRQTLKLKVGAAPGEDENPLAENSSKSSKRAENPLGISVVRLTAEQKRMIDLESGVLIQDVYDGPAAMIGLRPGDVITHLNNQQVGSVKSFNAIAQKLPKDRSLSMRVLRQGRASFITFKLSR